MSSQIMVIDRIACDGFGTCAQLFPERIALDEWGYPIIDPTPVSGTQLKHAKRAVSSCPRLALSLTKAPKEAPAARR